jgi:hypothetical protein
MVDRYEVVIHPRAKETSIDGNTFTLDFWQAAKIVAEHNKAGVRVGCSKQFDVSLDVINKIINQIK